MKHTILGIHGAFSTPNIFNYIKREVKNSQWEFLDYQHVTSDVTNILKDAQRSYSNSQPMHIIGHSMGGLIALGLADQPWVKSITTIATPLGGLDLNVFQTYLSRSSFLKETSSSSNFVNNLHNKRYTVPVKHLISTQGFNPYIFEPSDGVVTLYSQRAWAVGSVSEIYANHAEIMMNPETVVSVLNFWQSIDS